MSSFNPVSAILLLLPLLLIGCSPDASDDESKRLSDIIYVDAGVESCVDFLMEVYRWETLEDVKELNCAKTGKAHGSLPETGIWDTSDLAQFVYLEDLDVSGNYYTEFDTSALVRLKRLNMEMSFIKALDLSHNVKLEFIDVSSTPISKLDLSSNSKVHTVIARSTATNADIYQGSVVQGIEELLEQAGLPADWGNEIKSLTMEIIVTTPLELTLHPTAQIRSISTKSKSLIDLKDSSHLRSANGNFTVSSISEAELLETFSGSLSGSKVLDISNSDSLISFRFESDVIEEIRIPSSLLRLYVDSPLVRFSAEASSKLTALELIANAQQRLPFDENDMKINYLPLTELTISNYNTSRFLELRDLSQLLTLQLHNNYIDISLFIPDSLRYLMISSAENSHTIDPGENLNALYLTEVASGFCTLDEYAFANLNSLHITECRNSTIDLTKTPGLHVLNLDRSDIEEIDLAAVPELVKLKMIDTHLQTIDFSPLSGRDKLESFQFRSEYASDAERADIEARAKDFFENVYVN